MIITDCFFNDFFYFFKGLTQNGRFDYISFCITAAYAFLCFCVLIVNLIKPKGTFSRLKEMLCFIVWCVIADFAVCLLEYEYVGIRFSSVFSVVAFVCFKLCFMLIIYRFVQFLSVVKLNFYQKCSFAQKKSQNIDNQKKDCFLGDGCKKGCRENFAPSGDRLKSYIKSNENLKNIRLSEEVCGENNEKLSLQILDKICLSNKPFVDVNFAYLRETVKALKGKNLSDEDRRFADDLELFLKNKISYDAKCVQELNEYLRILVKKAVIYGVSV